MVTYQIILKIETDDDVTAEGAAKFVKSAINFQARQDRDYEMAPKYHIHETPQSIRIENLKGR